MSAWSPACSPCDSSSASQTAGLRQATGRGRSPATTVRFSSGARATSFGMHAIQLAKILDPQRQVIVTASPRNHDLLRSLGADACFDYGEADVVEKVRKLGPIRAAIDTFGEKASTEQAALCLTASEEQKAYIVSSQPSKPTGLTTTPSHVKLDAVMSYTASGQPVRVAFLFHWPAAPSDVAEAERMMEALPGWIESGRLKAMPRTDITQSLARPAQVEGVLKAVVNEGLPLLAAGKVKVRS